MRMPTLVRATPPHSLLGALLVVLAVVLTVPLGITATEPARTLVVDASDPTAFATITEAVAAAPTVTGSSSGRAATSSRSSSTRLSASRATGTARPSSSRFRTWPPSTSSPTGPPRHRGDRLRRTDDPDNDIHENERPASRWVTPPRRRSRTTTSTGTVGHLGVRLRHADDLGQRGPRNGWHRGGWRRHADDHGQRHPRERAIRHLDREGATATIDGREVTGPYSE